MASQLSFESFDFLAELGRSFADGGGSCGETRRLQSLGPSNATTTRLALGATTRYPSPATTRCHTQPGFEKDLCFIQGPGIRWLPDLV